MMGSSVECKLVGVAMKGTGSVSSVRFFNLVTVLITMAMENGSVQWLTNWLLVSSFLAIRYSLFVNLIFMACGSMAREVSV